MLANIARLTTRRVANTKGAVRCFAGWSNMEDSVPVSKKAELRSLIADMAKRKDAALSTEAPAPIDWKAFEEQIGADEVAKIKADYEKQTYSDFTTSAKKEAEEVDAALSSTLSEISASQELMSQYSADAEAQREKVIASYTSEDTTLEEVLQKHPELNAKYDRQIENHEWDTDDIDADDIAAKRIALMEERWDASIMGGKLDENMQKEVIAEMEHKSSNAASSSFELDDNVRAHIAEMAEFAGEAVPDDATLHKWLELGKGELSESERAETSESKLFEMMEHYTTLGLKEKAENVKKLYESLEESGELVVDEDWRAGEVAAAAGQPPVESLGDFTPDELEGKSADEIEAMADEAAARNEFWRASQILLHHHRSTGEVDASSTDPNTFSGLANYMDRLARAMLRKD